MTKIIKPLIKKKIGVTGFEPATSRPPAIETAYADVRA